MSEKLTRSNAYYTTLAAGKKEILPNCNFKMTLKAQYPKVFIYKFI